MRFLKMTLLVPVALALFVVPMTLPSAREGGRNYSRCIHSCNETRRNCDDRCNIECGDLFPNSPSDLRACVSACRDICLTQEKDCKARCLADRKGDTSPEEP